MVMARYREQLDPQVMTAALDWFAAQVGSEALDRMLLKFVEHFPGSSVVRGQETPVQWLAGSTAGMPHRAVALEELMLLWTANRNEAFNSFAELFEETELAAAAGSAAERGAGTGGEDGLPAGDGAVAGIFRVAATDSGGWRKGNQSA